MLTAHAPTGNDPTKYKSIIQHFTINSKSNFPKKYTLKFKHKLFVEKDKIKLTGKINISLMETKLSYWYKCKFYCS